MKTEKKNKHRKNVWKKFNRIIAPGRCANILKGGRIFIIQNIIYQHGYVGNKPEDDALIGIYEKT